MDNEKRELLAERLLEAGALEARPGEEVPLRWNGAKALEDEALRDLLTAALADLIRDHYPAADGLTGEEWAPILGRILDLPVSGAGERPLVVLGSSGEIPKYLPALTELRKSGGSPAIAVIWNGREEDLRLSLDRADIRCHWLTDLESGAAAALQKSLLDLEDHYRLLPQD